jgi:hypothetical protein
MGSFWFSLWNSPCTKNMTHSVAAETTSTQGGSTTIAAHRKRAPATAITIRWRVARHPVQAVSDAMKEWEVESIATRTNRPLSNGLGKLTTRRCEALQSSTQGSYAKMIAYRLRHRPSRAALFFFFTGTAFATGKAGRCFFFSITRN